VRRHEYLTGVQGRVPEPFYDPLAFAITEAHRRGLELYAWFNPFRATHPQAKSPPALNHVTRTHPELVRHYGAQVWLDPGEPEARQRALDAVLDVVKRYDVDGVVFDDYFYPYPEKGWNGRSLDFPDEASWETYGVHSGLNRDDWRRANINQFVQKVSLAVHAAKPWVQFGISPFGIWRPGVPAGVSPKALDACGQLYADARRWLASGWVDFLVPQLYWPIASREESFPALLQWWRTQNVKGRHVFAGLNDAGAPEKFPADEIARQIQVVRAQTGNGGEGHYHLRNLLENPALARLVSAQYATPALVPASPWLDAVPPPKPELTVAVEKSGASVRWQNAAGEPARWWLLQVRTGGVWTTDILPAEQTNRFFAGSKFDAVSVRAVDRLGNVSAPAIWTPRTFMPAEVSRGAAKMRKGKL
jgi:uncharacterized lipoprotein YddW (UPF0748 family)